MRGLKFAADLALIGTSLANHRGEHAGRFNLQRVLHRLHAFGFHLAADVRQAPRCTRRRGSVWMKRFRQYRSGSPRRTTHRIWPTCRAHTRWRNPRGVGGVRTGAARRSYGSEALGPYRA